MPTEYEVTPRKDKRGVDLISDVLPCGRLWYDGPRAVSDAIGYAEFYSRSHDALIRVYYDAGNEGMRILPQRDAMGEAPGSGETSASG